MRATLADGLFSARWLIENGATICKTSDTVEKSENIFHFAALGNSVRVATMIFEKEKVKCNDNQSVMVKKLADLPNTEGKTPLFLAAREGHLDILKVFVKYGDPSFNVSTK